MRTIDHLQDRATAFGTLCKLYLQLALDDLPEAEIACYEDVADLLNQIEVRFQEAIFEIDEQGRLPLSIRRIPIGVAP